MNYKTVFSLFLVFFSQIAAGQSVRYTQYFDGADTNWNTSVFVHYDTGTENVWQVGPLQKSVFDSAATMPNALVTDTINTYPGGKASSFHFGFKTSRLSGYVNGFRWMQKLDMDFGHDGGVVEYSLDTGQTWINIFTDKNRYRFFGFDNKNADTLQNGVHAFTGTDTVWRDIWLCYLGGQYLFNSDSIIFKFTFFSDNIDSSKDGWMIDNLLVTETIYHSVSETDNSKQLLVYPTITDGIIKIKADEGNDDIDNIVVTDMSGRIVRRYRERTRDTQVDLSGLQAGNYLLSVQTESRVEVFPVVLNP